MYAVLVLLASLVPGTGTGTVLAFELLKNDRLIDERKWIYW